MPIDKSSTLLKEFRIDKIISCDSKNKLQATELTIFSRRIFTDTKFRKKINFSLPTSSNGYLLYLLQNN